MLDINIPHLLTEQWYVDGVSGYGPFDTEAEAKEIYNDIYDAYPNEEHTIDCIFE